MSLQPGWLLSTAEAEVARLYRNPSIGLSTSLGGSLGGSIDFGRNLSAELPGLRVLCESLEADEDIHFLGRCRTFLLFVWRGNSCGSDFDHLYQER